MRRLLQCSDIDVNAVGGGDGGTALYLAAGGGHWEVVKLLLERRHVDVNKAGALTRWWPACEEEEGPRRCPDAAGITMVQGEPSGQARWLPKRCPSCVHQTV